MCVNVESCACIFHKVPEYYDLRVPVHETFEGGPVGVGADIMDSTARLQGGRDDEGIKNGGGRVTHHAQNSGLHRGKLRFVVGTWGRVLE